MSSEIIVENQIENENINENIDENKVSEIPKRNFKDCIYGKIDVSVESMDKFIFVLLVLLVISIILGVIL